MLLVLRRQTTRESASAVEADQAKILRLGGVRALLVVPHADGWYAVRVGPPHLPLDVNEERTDFARVGVGDLVAVGTTRFVVEVADDADAPSFEPGGEAMACRLEIDGRTTTVRDGIRLIGSAPYCDIPVEGHGEAVLAVLAPKDRRWLLYALDGPGSPTEPIWQALREGTDYRVGTHTATVELLAEYELTDDEPPREIGPLTLSGETVRGTTAASFDEPPQAADDTAEAGDREYARRLLAWVSEAIKTKVVKPIPPDPAIVARRKPTAPKKIAERLTRDPYDREALIDLTAWAESRGWHDLHRIGLRRLVQSNPNDAPMAERAIVAYLAAGRDDRQPPVEREKLLGEAGRFLASQIKAYGHTDRLAELESAIDVERTILGLKPVGAA
jgi:hypothetical protein